MSKASSKVIKADSFSVSEPYTVHKNLFGVPAVEQNNSLYNQLNTLNEIDYVDELDGSSEIAEPNISVGSTADEHQNYNADSASQDAASILAETEEMVKELLKTAKEQAEMLIDQAREEAENIIYEARSEVESLKQQAKQTGHKEGYSQGVNEAAAEAAVIREEARQIMLKASADRDKLIAGTEQDVIQLVLAIAEKVIREELSSRTELVGTMVKEALAKATDRESIIVKVNPEDLDYIMSISEELRKEIKGIRKFKVISDGIISRGGCIVETPNGSVDARLERQLTELREALMEVG